ncbi:MAG: TonB-dependent receptor plug domain-containing protein, partial [Pseudomonadales bacterium]|nr:TonB-dependent receptor plug domain-containing protein [Pseudomonadales bacterium]
MSKKNQLSVTMTTGLACVLGTLATASGVAAAEESKSKGFYVLEEIVVTARKREESLQDAPISITAFSGEGLEQRNITALADISQITPNLVFNANAPISGSSATASVFIRGIGQNDYTLVTEPGVGIYIDGVYIARSVGGALDLVDVAQIEVLRGPQGTLFGRNTIGGAISITSKNPNEELGGKVQLTLGDDDLMDFKAKLNLPISETLMSSISISSKQRDGFVKNVETGRDLGDDDSLSGRVALRWLPSDSVAIDVNVDATRERENSAASFAVAADGLSPLGAANNVVFLGHLGCAPPPGPLDNPNCFNSQWVTNGKRISNGTHPQYSELDIWGVGLTVEWDISESLTLKSITSYRDLDSAFSQDAD